MDMHGWLRQQVRQVDKQNFRLHTKNVCRRVGECGLVLLLRHEATRYIGKVETQMT